MKKLYSFCLLVILSISQRSFAYSIDDVVCWQNSSARQYIGLRILEIRTAGSEVVYYKAKVIKLSDPFLLKFPSAAFYRFTSDWYSKFTLEDYFAFDKKTCEQLLD